MPYPERWGGGALPYEVYLQALEEIGGAWASVGVGLSVHVMSCWPLATFGSPDQQERWLGDLLGAAVGGYCLSEADAGSDPAAMRTRATRMDGGYRVAGAKAWVTHGGEADFYTLFARTSDDPRRGISCFLCPADAPGLEALAPERKMGLTGSTTTAIDFDGVELDSDRLIGDEGGGLSIALTALDRATGHRRGGGRARPALPGRSRRLRPGPRTFGRPIIEHQGLGFLLADMASAVESARATMLEAARRRDRGLPFSRQASIAKLVATDTAMKVSTDAVQALGGAATPRISRSSG